MAVAFAYPEPAKVKRRGSSVTEEPISSGRLSMARAVLAYSPELAREVFAGGGKSLNDALAEAETRRDAGACSTSSPARWPITAISRVSFATPASENAPTAAVTGEGDAGSIHDDAAAGFARGFQGDGRLAATANFALGANEDGQSCSIGDRLIAGRGGDNPGFSPARPARACPDPPPVSCPGHHNDRSWGRAAGVRCVVLKLG